MRTLFSRIWVLAAVLALTGVVGRAQAPAGDAVLTPAETTKLLPEKVWFKGQSATTQLRNSGGVKFADGSYVLATLVDNSGYSTGVAAKYQGYFVVEVPIKIGGQSLPAGIYGMGFLAGDKFVVTDVGAHDVLTVASTSDADLKRPMPLKVVADPAGGFRIYAGRSYVVFSR